MFIPVISPSTSPDLLMPVHASQIYATELANLKHGHPLWIPEGSDRFPDIVIGDVGYINSVGIFEYFFNVQEKYKDDPGRKMKFFIPESECEYFNFGDKTSEPQTVVNYLRPGEHCSRTMKKIELEGSLGGYVLLPPRSHICYLSEPSGIAIADGQVGGTYASGDSESAACVIPESAELFFVNDSKDLHAYTKKHMENWYNHVSKRKTIELERMLLIQGMVSTPQFVLTAARAPSHKSKSAYAEGNIYSIARASIKFSISTDRTSHVDDHVLVDGDATFTGRKLPIFLRYFKMKKRYGFLKRLEAGAGPHTLPDADDPDNDMLVVVDQDGNEGSAAQVSIASV